MRTIKTIVLIGFFCILTISELNAMANNKASLNVLVYSKTIGYRHESTPDAIKSIAELADNQNWDIKFTEDSCYFTSKNLEKYDVIVFLLTFGEILDNTGKEALKGFIQSGKGLVTIHTGPATLAEWPWYVNLIGASFIGHPPVEEGKLIIEDKAHPSVEFITEDEIMWTEEWHSFSPNPRAKVNVLMSVDEGSYNVDDDRWYEGIELRMGDHPLVWYRESEGGRIFQTALGHEPAAYKTEFLRKHIIGAIRWAGNIVE